MKASRGFREVQRSADAEALWAEMYARFNTGSGRRVVDRAEAHTMRLAMLYALLDGSAAIEREASRSRLCALEILRSLRAAFV